jgi:hypothetical protein
MNPRFLLLVSFLILLAVAPVVAQEDAVSSTEFERISVENIGELRQVDARFGGWLSNVTWLSNTTLAINDVAGTSRYDTMTPDIPPQPMLTSSVGGECA